jgi:hypothetical protein
MYTQMFGGSALLHLIAAHPRVVALVGITATATALMAPLGPGRFIGSESHLERIEAAIRPQAAITEARQAAAEREAARLLARQETGEIEAAVEHTLERCGGGCTDISMRQVVSDPVLLRRVLVLHELDMLARAGEQTTRK